MECCWIRAATRSGPLRLRHTRRQPSTTRRRPNEQEEREPHGSRFSWLEDLRNCRTRHPHLAESVVLARCSLVVGNGTCTARRTPRAVAQDLNVEIQLGDGAA